MTRRHSSRSARLVDDPRDHRPRKATHRGVQLVQPISQGDYDGLCGVYAVVNGIRLAMAPYYVLNIQETRGLFINAIRFLERRGKLAEAVCWSVERDMWLELAEKLAMHAMATTGVTLSMDQPFDVVELPDREGFAAIERLILDRKALLAYVRGALQHYTVISGYSPASFRLFDSYGLHHLRKPSCSTMAGTGVRHRIHLASMLVMAAV